ncbi:MAG: alpha/beta fold hydrolase [Acidimicrobiales bacterium]|jgi:putative phosphoribosyl transferase
MIADGRPRVVVNPGNQVIRPLTWSRFVDRADAGWRLAERLERFRGTGAVVLGLPRGGVPVAYQVASAIDAPLDVIVVRKLGVPFQPELAMGAIGEDGVRVLDERVLAQTGVSAAEIAEVESAERAELESRIRRYRRGRDRTDLQGRIAIVVDDGIATGSTARVACRIARLLGAAKVVLAVPVGPSETLRNFAEADEVVAVSESDDFRAVGNHYVDFSPTSDDEVVVLLDRAARRYRAEGWEAEAVDCDIDVEIPAGGVTMQGHLHAPEPARGLVVFAHGSGSSRHSPRNRMVAEVLYDAGLGTLLLDLLTPGEERDRAFVFDIRLLADRLTAATEWARQQPETGSCRIGYFGASTGAGAALWAAADHPEWIDAVVSRGGRPDLAMPRLADVVAPTLLIVGSEDVAVLDLNKAALAALPPGRGELSVVPGATHLFEEPGTLAEAAILARNWFTRHLLVAGDVAAGTGEGR